MTQKFVFLPTNISELFPFITELQMIGYENDLDWNLENIPPDGKANSVLVFASDNYRTFAFKHTDFFDEESALILNYADAVNEAESIMAGFTPKDTISLDEVRSPDYDDQIERHGESSDSCFLCGRRTKSHLYVHYTTDGDLTQDDNHPASQGFFPIGSECKRKLPASFIKDLNPHVKKPLN